MKKVFGQTVRDIKRGVNKKVLKVPGIEQKVLDATSNEPWGPHGTLLAEIAQATRNYHEYQMIMAVIWKRINDTGKNWRHVYKALTVLEYLVGHGSERVIADIREHSYQISTLSDFQYIDSSGSDQGSNVRRKSQSLVALVNDKERIIEVRQKAAANREKFCNTSAEGMYGAGSFSSSGGYGDRYDYDRSEGRYGNRDDDQNGYGYGREREYGYRDDDRYGRYGDSNSRDGDHYGRDYRDCYSKDDDYHGRSRSVDDHQDGSSRNGRKSFDDDGQLYSGHEQKFSEQNIGAPPSFEAVNESQSPIYSERRSVESSAPTGPGASSPAAAPGSSSPPAPPGVSSPPAPPGCSPSSNPAPGSSSLPANHHPSQGTYSFGNSTSSNEEVMASDEFDPRGSIPAAPTISNSAEMDLLGSLSDSFSSNALAIMPAIPATSTVEVDANSNSGSVSTFTAIQPAFDVMNQTFEDPFGDSPFKAIPSTETAPAQQHISAFTTPFDTTFNQNTEVPQPDATKVESVSNYDNSFYGVSYSAPSASNVQPSPANSQFLPQELSTSQQEIDILADILPPSGPSPSVPSSQIVFPTPTGQPAHPSANMYMSLHPHMGSMTQVASNAPPQMSSGSAVQVSGGNFISQGNSLAPAAFYMAPQHVQSMTPIVSNAAPQMSSGSAAQLSSGNFIPQASSAATVASYMAPQTPAGPAAQFNGNFLPHQGSAVPTSSQVAHQNPTGPAPQQDNDLLNNFLPQTSNPPTSSQPALPSTGLLAIVPQSQPSKDKFEPKSAVWADTLSRGLVNLNISGSKTNPLADIGVDFDAINRKEKRMEKQPPQNAVTSTITMGKAMGSGSGLGRAGASTLRAANPLMGSNMGMGGGAGMVMNGGVGSGMGMGIGGYRGMNQSLGMGIGMGMGMGMGMGAGMNMGMGQGPQMQPQAGMPMPPGSSLPGGYRPMMSYSGYSQQPYGGGYR